MGMQYPKKVTASGVVRKGAGKVGSVTLIPAAADATLKLYDAESVSGDEMVSVKALANAKSEQQTFVPGIRFANALYADIAGAGAVAIVAYY